MTSAHHDVNASSACVSRAHPPEADGIAPREAHHCGARERRVPCSLCYGKHRKRMVARWQGLARDRNASSHLTTHLTGRTVELSGHTSALLALPLAALLLWSASEGPSPPQEGNSALPAASNLPYYFDAPRGARSSGLSPGDRHGSRVPQSLGPTLLLLDSIVLQETRQSYIGNPMVMFSGPDSSLYVIDSFGQSVLRFDRMGQQIRRYGRAGGGSG